MSRVCYSIMEGVTLSPIDDGRYCLSNRTGQEAKLHPPALLPLFYLDGIRSAEEIVSELNRVGTAIPISAVDEIFRSLEIAGMIVEIETPWKPLEINAWPSHRCQGCGACCQGHWIGPLSREFIDKTTDRMPALRAAFPALETRKPFVRMPGDQYNYYLNSETGQCLFLDVDRFCMLHKTFGHQEKPGICQMFPHVRFEDRSVTRIGVGLMCLTHFDQVIDGEAPATDLHWQALSDQLDGRLFHYYPTQLENDEELALLEKIQSADEPVMALLSDLVQHSEGEADKTEVTLYQQALMHLKRCVEYIAEDPIMAGLLKQQGPFPDTLKEVVAWIKAGFEGDSQSQVPFHDDRGNNRISSVVNDGLLRFIWLRQYLMFNGLRHGLSVFFLGIWLARQVAARQGDDNRLFGTVLACWMRMIQSPDVRRAIYSGPEEVDAFLSLCHREWIAG